MQYSSRGVQQMVAWFESWLCMKKKKPEHEKTRPARKEAVGPASRSLTRKYMPRAAINAWSRWSRVTASVK